MENRENNVKEILTKIVDNSSSDKAFKELIISLSSDVIVVMYRKKLLPMPSGSGYDEFGDYCQIVIAASANNFFSKEFPLNIDLAHSLENILNNEFTHPELIEFLSQLSVSTLRSISPNLKKVTLRT